MLVAAPAFVLLGSLAISETLERAAKDLRTPVDEPAGDAGAAPVGRGSDGGAKRKAGK